MTILYYVPYISQANGGIRQYACSMLEALAEDDEHRYIVVHNGHDEVIMDIIQRYPHLIHVSPAIGQEQWYERLTTNVAKLVNQIQKSRQKSQFARVGSYVDRICKRYKVDIVHCPYQHAPHTAWPVVSTMHDIQEIHLPELFTPAERAERATIFMGIAERATHIVVSFEHVRQDMIKYFRRKPGSVTVCPLNLRKMWFDVFQQSDVLPRNELSVPDFYCLYPAATWPHKNHSKLLEALSTLKKNQGRSIKLICTGHKNTHFEELSQLINDLSLKEQVVFKGVVNEKTLFSLYKHARAVIIPTLYEAGSYPLFESLFLGIPVVCSSVTSLPETINDIKYLFNPQDKNQIADRLKRIMLDADYRESNLKIGKIRTEQLRGQTPLSHIKEVYKVTLNSISSGVQLDDLKLKYNL